MSTHRAAMIVCCLLLVPALRAQTRASDPAPQTGIAAGRIIDHRGAPLGGAVVRIMGPLRCAERDRPDLPVCRVIADEHGHFAFTGLPAGQFWLQASRDGYVEGAYGQPRPFAGGASVQLEDRGRRTDLTITLWKFAAVSGTVSDETGAPVAGVSLAVLRRSVRAGRPHFEATSARGGQTNDQGEYRLFGLVPGQYVLALREIAPAFILAAPNTGEPARAFVYPATTHPLPSAGGMQEVLALAPGQELSGIDFRMAPVPASQVSGVVRGGDGTRRVNLRLVPEGEDDLALTAVSNARSAQVRADGAFAFEAVPAGRYVLRAVTAPTTRQAGPGSPQTVIQTSSGSISMWVNLSNRPDPPTPPLPPEPTWLATLPVIIGTEDVKDLSLEFRPTARITGRLQFDGSAAIPRADGRPHHLSILLEPADGRTQFENAPRVTITNGTELTIAGAVPGRYVIRADTDSAWSLKSVSAGGRDISTSVLDVGATDIDDVVLVFTDRLTTIGGRAIADTTQPATGPSVFLFPIDRRLWMDYGQYSRRLQRREVTTAGSYLFAPVPPGDYFLVAASGDVDEAWQDPETLARLALAAERVTVGEGDRPTIDLRVRIIR